MSTLPVRRKQPGEARTLSFEFADKIPAGDGLTGTPVVTAATGLTAGSPTISDTRVLVRISGGTSGTDYNVDCLVNTVGGEILKLDCTVEVREQAN